MRKNLIVVGLLVFVALALGASALIAVAYGDTTPERETLTCTTYNPYGTTPGLVCNTDGGVKIYVEEYAGQMKITSNGVDITDTFDENDYDLTINGVPQNH